MHISVPIANTMEYFNEVKISPLISKVNIKVCYVGQEPNRNGTVITKDVAKKLGDSIRGVPIVGYFNEQTGDFEGHNREVVTEDNEFKIIDTTKPYGFVDLNAKVWFEKFLDDGVEHEYLVTEGYIWTGIYEESKRVPEKGNNQSMELGSEKGFWTNDNKSNKRIFIINDGLIEKLCILGQDVEPCFEGSQIKAHFSLEDNPEFISFKETMFSMINELKYTLSKGGSQEDMEEKKILESEFEKQEEKDQKENPQEDPKKKNIEENACGDKKEKKYNLDEIEEYVTLQSQYNELQNKYSILEQENSTLKTEIESLRSFKLAADRKEKQAMIDSFYMLSDEDKKSVTENIDNYSLRDIEAELSIVCVRNKVNFNLEEQPQQQYSLNLNMEDTNKDEAPDWIKAVRAKSES